MSNSLKASKTGLAVVERTRQRLGWTKTNTSRWWESAHTSRATLRRFWQGERIQRDIFIAICEAVGISNWEEIAEPETLDSDPKPNHTTSQIHWQEAPDIDSFFGRTQELEQLHNWSITQQCKLIAIIGIGGIGKTALTLALADRIQDNFHCLIWRTFTHSPSLLSVLHSLLATFNQTPVPDIHQAINEIINNLQQRRCLVILDGLETVIHTSEYSQFISQLSCQRHQSCIIITSRQQPPNLDFDGQTIRCLPLQGLAKAAALELLQSRGLTGQKVGISALIQLYRGNPLALKIVTPLIQSVFGGNIAEFLNQNTLVMGDRLRQILHQQLQPLSPLERDILYWLAIWQQPISFPRLQTHFLISPDPGAVLEAITSLEHRSLLEKWYHLESSSFTLQPLVMKAVTDELVDRAAAEIQQVVQSQDMAHFQVLRTHWLLRPGTDDIVGDRILHHLRDKLWRLYGATLPETLEKILLLLTDKPPIAIGYISHNLIALLN
ncbi:MAG TPA: hypothetical protein IGS52_22600 [Oscillatoriaceae cyanobacterium M33_DOE_052]|uniref:NB-ARC domain-containing protein n=1 Tax=Planktothricoides sp. SpSt-374 TaxID=2282167 RepID=A0A7C4A187_9CYAN|nr:hypothetical protein [Oscillatoriaceae cyanobacterium M33_DOE_052]